MPKSINEINSKTNVPLFAVFGIIPALLIVAFFVWNADAKATTALKQNEAMKLESDSLKKHVFRIEKSVIRLEIKAGTLPKNYPNDSDE